MPSPNAGAKRDSYTTVGLRADSIQLYAVILFWYRRRTRGAERRELARGAGPPWVYGRESRRAIRDLDRAPHAVGVRDCGGLVRRGSAPGRGVRGEHRPP